MKFDKNIRPSNKIGIVLEKRINLFPDANSSQVTKDISLAEYFNRIRDGYWQDVVLEIRNAKKEKKDAPGVTVSGLFHDKRKDINITQHSNLIAIDIDNGHNLETDFIKLKKDLIKDQFCYALHHSIGGYGIVLYIQIDGNKHREAYYSIERYLYDSYKIVADSSCQNESRLRFVSYDPELFVNTNSLLWNKYIPKERIPSKSQKIEAFHNDDIEYIMQQIKERGINMADDYLDWIKIGFSIVSEFGEGGREYYHLISRQSSKYSARGCDKQFNNCIKSFTSSRGISIGTFFWYCKNHRIEIKTQKSNEIEQEAIKYAKQQFSKSKKNNIPDLKEKTIEFLEKDKHIPKERSAPIIEKLNLNSLSKSNEKTERIENFLRPYSLEHNLVTNRVELNGEPITDRDINSIYVDAMKCLGYTISKAKIQDYIYSDFIPSYNPFLDFFDKNAHLKPKGKVEELLACFDYEKPDISQEELTIDEKNADYLEVFMERWLLGIISAMNGIYSLLILVLNGPQGSGKSKFFRGLLPLKLRPYYAESKLDGGKDDEILMTNSIIIMDDEFSGKSKVEAKKLKELSSRDTFTIRKPYGRTSEILKRYAVLCGTSNDEQILNDPTGNRRLIPLNVKSIDLKKFEAIDKTELFMELYWSWKECGDCWMLGKKEIQYLNKATIRNEQPSYEKEMIMRYFEPGEDKDGACFLTCSEMKNEIEINKKERMNIYKMGPILKKLGFEQKRSGPRRPYCVVRLYPDIFGPTPPEI